MLQPGTPGPLVGAILSAGIDEQRSGMQAAAFSKCPRLPARPRAQGETASSCHTLQPQSEGGGSSHQETKKSHTSAPGSQGHARPSTPLPVSSESHPTNPNKLSRRAAERIRNVVVITGARKASNVVLSTHADTNALRGSG